MIALLFSVVAALAIFTSDSAAWSHGQGGTPWSTLGVLDNNTDVTSALNALPQNTAIIGDCPNGGIVRADSAWIWRSNLTIYQQNGCRIISHVSGVGTYAITQTDLTTPLTNIHVDGLQISKSSQVSSERILRLWVDHLKLLNWNFGTNGGAMFIRGSDQEIAYGRQTDTHPDVGNPGIRHIGNTPKVASSAGMPANVWVHDNVIQSGDAAYQVGQPLNTSIWTNVSSDDILYENNSGQAISSALILIGLTANTPTFSNFTISNIIMRNITGSGGHRGIIIQSGDNVGSVVSNVSLLNISAGVDVAVTVAPGVEVDTSGAGTINSVVLDSVRLLTPSEIGMTVSGNVTDFTFQNGLIQAPQTGGLSNVTVTGTLRTTISGSTIGALAGNNVTIGTSAVSPRVTGNLLTDVNQNRSGVSLVDVNLATVTGNTMLRKSGTGTTRAIGVSLATAGAGAGTTNSTVTGNNVSNMNNTPPIVCAPPSQGNTVINNTGASDCP